MESRQRYKLTKLSDNEYQFSDMPNVVTGKLVFELKEGKPLMLRMDNYKFRVTSTVIDITVHKQGYRTFETMNSSYMLEPID